TPVGALRSVVAPGVHSVAEGDADPRPGVGDLQHRVLPGPLGVAAGHEEVAVPQREGARASATARAEEEAPGLAERDEGDDRLVDALGNLVPVPGHAVLTVPVEVEPGGVEEDAVPRGEGRAHLVEDGRLERPSAPGAPAGSEAGLDPVLLVEEARALR